MKKLTALLALLLVPVAHAATVTVDWTNPSTYTDGTPLPLAAIQQTRIEYGTCSGALFGTRIADVVALGSAVTAVTPNLGPGTYCLRAYTRAGGVESAPTNAIQVIVPVPVPNAPTNLRVTLN
jgi:hypothetical protein